VRCSATAMCSSEASVANFGDIIDVGEDEGSCCGDFMVPGRCT
jgi:hypothetical protein